MNASHWWPRSFGHHQKARCRFGPCCLERHRWHGSPHSHFGGTSHGVSSSDCWSIGCDAVAGGGLG
eukprot:14541013-Alexandrium_andersonii.AAC.1